VLIDVNSHARLTDFGLSSVVNAGEDLTYLAVTTRRPGALRWAAPELVVKDNDHIAPTFGSDIYSFGSVMLQVGLYFNDFHADNDPCRRCLDACRGRRSRI
jgi:serine/threonine protein kinase